MNLSQIEPIQVMLSSRCDDNVSFEGRDQQMRVLRMAIKTHLESLKIGIVALFKVWIHEDDPHQSGDGDAWEKCMEQARNADVVLVLYNGACGWAMERDKVSD